MAVGPDPVFCICVPRTLSANGLTYLCLGLIFESMRTTVRLREEILRRAKKRAAEEGRTLTSLIEEGLLAVLSRPAGNGRTGRIKLPISKASGGVRPGVDINSSGALEDLMDGHDTG